MSKVLRSVGSEIPQFWCVGWVNVCTVSYYKDWIDNNGFTAKWTTERASYFKTKKGFNGIILFEHLFFENPSLSVRMEGRGWGEKRMLHYLFLTIFSYYGGCWAAKPGSLVIEHNSMTDNNTTSPRDNVQPQLGLTKYQTWSSLTMTGWKRNISVVPSRSCPAT